MRTMTAEEARSHLAEMLAGLAPGEEIVVNGLQRVRPGMPVSPEKGVAVQEKGIAQR